MARGNVEITVERDSLSAMEAYARVLQAATDAELAKWSGNIEGIREAADRLAVWTNRLEVIRERKGAPIEPTEAERSNDFADLLAIMRRNGVEDCDFETLRDAILAAGQSLLPALLAAAVEASVRKNVFSDLLAFVRKAEVWALTNREPADGA